MAKNDGRSLVVCICERQTGCWYLNWRSCGRISVLTFLQKRHHVYFRWRLGRFEAFEAQKVNSSKSKAGDEDNDNFFLTFIAKRHHLMLNYGRAKRTQKQKLDFSFQVKQQNEKTVTTTTTATIYVQSRHWNQIKHLRGGRRRGRSRSLSIVADKLTWLLLSNSTGAVCLFRIEFVVVVAVGGGGGTVDGGERELLLNL